VTLRRNAPDGAVVGHERTLDPLAWWLVEV
jgi:hypothetical protein